MLKYVNINKKQLKLRKKEFSLPLFLTFFAHIYSHDCGKLLIFDAKNNP